MDIHTLADQGLLTPAQYDAAMRYKALWSVYTQPWAYRATIPWGEHATLTEPQHHLAWRFKQAQDVLARPDNHHQRLVGQVAIHGASCDDECLPWIRSALDELAAHFGAAV